MSRRVPNSQSKAWRQNTPPPPFPGLYENHCNDKRRWPHGRRPPPYSRRTRPPPALLRSTAVQKTGTGNTGIHPLSSNFCKTNLPEYILFLTEFCPSGTEYINSTKVSEEQVYFRDRLLKAYPMKLTYQPNCAPITSLSTNQCYYFDNKKRLGDHPSITKEVFPKHLKLLHFLLLAALLLLAIPAQAQFERVFGTALDESFSKVIQSGSSYYVLGSGEITDGPPARATVSRLNATGELAWTLSLNTAAVWTDIPTSLRKGQVGVSSSLSCNH